MPRAQAASAQESAESRTDRRVGGFEIILLALLAALAVWKGLVPGWRVLNTDFPNYYVAARLICAHYCLDRLYEWIWLQRIASKFGIDHQLLGFLGLTPFSALPVLPFSWLPVLEAKRAWVVCNVALLGVALHLLSRQCGLNQRRAWLIALCAVIPLRTSFLSGQMHILVLFLLVAAYVLHMRGRQISTGCCIALAAALKVYPVFFCIYFIIKKRWKALAAVAICTCLCLIVSYLVAGRAAMGAYLFQQLPRSLQGESENPFLPSLTSSSAMFHRLFLYELELNPHPLIQSAFLYALLYPLWQALLAAVVLCRMRTGFRADATESLEWSAFLCLLMFLSSAPASYQFVVLIAAAVPTVSILLHQHRRRLAIVYVCLYIAAANARTIQSGRPAGALMLFLYQKLWCGVALIAFYCWILKPQPAVQDAANKRLLRTPALRTAALILCLWIPAAYGAWSHLRSMRPANPIRALSRDAAYMRISPMSAGSGLLYIAMTGDGYRLRSTAQHLGHSDSNQFSFAANPSGSDLWIETVSDGTSQLLRIPPGTNGTANCDVDNAETPALSGDGSLLAVVREDQGRGSLWTLNLRRCGESGDAEPVRVTPAAFDVRTVSAATNNTFLISAVYQDKERVFTVAPGETPKVLGETDGSLDSPALSPDRKLLAVRELVAERWQLMLLDLFSREWKQVTSGDCNAYTPSWRDNHTLLYATDCSRGVGLTTLASIQIDR